MARDRKIVVRVSFDVLYGVPSDFEESTVDYAVGERCTDNVVERLYERVRAQEGVCSTCFIATTERLRDATPEDVERLGWTL